MDNRAITPEMAQQELQRRQAARDELARRQNMQNQQPAQDEQEDQMAKMQALLGNQRTPVDSIRDLAQGALTGLGKGGQFVGEQMEKIPGFHKLQEAVQGATGISVPRVDMDQILAPVGSPHKSMGGELLKGIGEYLPYGIAGGPSLMGQAAAGLSSGAALSPEGHKTSGSLKGALLNVLTHGALKGLEALRPSKMFRGSLSPEELAHNLEVTEGTNTGIGDVIESPTLKRAQENIMANVPFGGVPEAMQKNAAVIQQKGSNLLEGIGQQLNPETQNVALQDALKKAAAQARQEKTANYTKVNKIADDMGFNVGRENFQKQAKAALADIKASPELEKEFDPSLLADIQRYAENPQGNTLKLSNIFRGKLGDKANDLYINGKTYESNIIKDLRDSLGKDIESGIESTGSKELKAAHAEAQKNYKENFAPFEDKDIVKFTKKGGDPDLLLQHFVRTGKASDRSTLLGKLMRKLGENEKHIPLQMYLSRANENGQFNPLKLRTLYKNLGSNQKNQLIKDNALRKNLEDYIDLVGKNTESFNTMFNPKTGQRNLDATLKLGEGLAGYHFLGGIPGAAAGIAIPAISTRILNKAMTSPSLRESLIQQMIENKPKFDTMLKRRGAESLSQGLINQMNRNDDNGS